MKKSITDVILNGERLNAFSPTTGNKTGVLLLPLLLDFVLEVLARGLGKRQETQ